MKGYFIFLLFLSTQQLTCVSHYYPSGELCLECNSNCQECQGEPTYCLSCPSKYTLSNHTCTACPDQCFSCRNSITCSACDSGSYLKNGRCAACMNKCATCNETTCFTCLLGYSFASDCTLCANGYFWNNIYAVCNQCSPGCQSCTGFTSCSVCQDNYFNDKGACRYNGPASISSDKSQMMIFIIMGAVVGGILVLTCIIYIIYRLVASKRAKKEVNIEGSQVDIRMSQSQGLCQQLSVCVVCNEAKAEIVLTCGHQLHQGCIRQQTKPCPISPEKEVFFDQLQNFSQVQSQLTSEQSRKQTYLDNSTIKDKNAQLEIVRMEEQ